MSSVWKRLQRVGKKASKFQFVASYQELTIECTKKWQPDKLRVVWTRRNRRICTKLHGWQPGIKNPYRGTVLWQVPENVDITVTLFKDPNADEFEDKDWTFVIENETKGHRKVLASVEVNMKKYANVTSATFDLTLQLKPLSVKVVDATLKLSLTCIFLKEGKATDEDMQSLASLMSLKPSDVGNLDDFNDSDEEEKRASTGPVRSMTFTVTSAAPGAWKPPLPSFSPPAPVSSPDSSVVFHFNPVSEPLPAPYPLKSYRSLLSELGSALTRPTSMPSAAETATWHREWRSPEVKPSLCPTSVTSEEPVCHQAVQSSDTLRRPASVSSSISALAPPLKKANPFTPLINTPLSPLPLTEILPIPTPNVPPTIAPLLSLSHPSEVASCTVSYSLPRSNISVQPGPSSHSSHVAVPPLATLTPNPLSFLHSNTTTVTSKCPLTPHPNVSTQLSASFSTAAVDPEVKPPDVAQPESHRQLSILTEEEYPPSAVCPGEDNADIKTLNTHPAKDLRPSQSKTGHGPNHKPESESVFKLQTVRPAARPQNQSAQEISALIQATCNKHRREELRTFSVTSPQKHAGARKDETSQPPQMQETSRNSWLQESSSVEVLKDKRPISPCPNASMASPCGSKINSSLTDESLHTKERVSVVSQTECLSDISQNKTRSIVDDKKLDNSVTIVDKDFTTKPLEQSPTVLPVPLPRVKKRLSASLPDEYSIESGMTEISTGCICASDNNEMSSHAKVSDLSKGSDAENKIKLRKRNQVSPANMSDSEIDMKVITDVQPGKETKDERRPEQTASELQVKSVDQVKPTEPLLPMARVRKRYSASFNDDVPFLHDQGQKEAHPPVPAPRSKKRLSATFPDENTCEAKHGVSFMDQTESTKPLVSGKESSLEFIKKTADGLELGGNKSFSSALVTACPETSSIIYLHPSAEALPVSETATSNVPENVGNIQRQEGRSSEENQDVETTVKNVNQGKGEDKVHLATVSLNETAATLDLKRQAIKILQASLSPGLV
ncbi:uncharacterized protein ehbp1l1a isoform X5 [Silurus meridionalis]|uniref:uncharacterized protein ehbp1l1a isoform X5 n=1 Tax=Silurus meridionalis TaxID=175797 RepID=UPI001EEB32F5|nr:uncharacterized protein ehbp1l1a isoform X5 [Silurus meridionalis]